jgi:taurine dioxygenase
MTITEPRPDTRLDVRRLSADIGAELRGVDLKEELDDDQVQAIRQALLDHKVVFFPDQHLDPDQHLAVAARFGEPTPGHPVLPSLEGHPQVFQIDYQDFGASKVYGDIAERYESSTAVSWHTDVTFVARPPLGSLLNAVVIPEAGGDTYFSNQQAAYEALSEPLRAFLDTLTAVHDGSDTFGAALAYLEAEGKVGEWDDETFAALEPVEHPVVRTHPETGEKALFVNPGFTSHIKGLRRAESDALLGYLYEHSVRPEFTVRYHWTQGTLGFWDNRVTQHSVVGDIGDQARVIQRITLRGDEPR